MLEDRSVPAVSMFRVNTTADTAFDHTVVVNGFVTPVDANGNTSLRAAVEYANLNPEAGNWNQNHYTVDLSPLAGGTITLNPNLGTLALDSNIGFLGNGATVERNVAQAAFRLFDLGDVKFGANTGDGVEAHFSNMTLQGGRAPFNDPDGGAILVERPANGGQGQKDVLIIESCDLNNNSASGNGGAVAAVNASGAAVYITYSTLGLNKADANGGAIYTNGASHLEITGSSITGNEANGNVAGGDGFGGGLDIITTITLLNSTNIIGNSATNAGGGLYFSDSNSLGSLTMNYGQFYGNTSGADGGGFYLDAPGDTINFTQVAVTQNTAGNKGGGGYVNNGTLDGTLMALSGNQDANGVNGATAGIAYKQANGAAAPIALPPGPPPGTQAIVAD